MDHRSDSNGAEGEVQCLLKIGILARHRAKSVANYRGSCRLLSQTKTRRWITSNPRQLASLCQPHSIIEPKQLHCCATSWRQPNNARAVQSKVLSPDLCSRIEERDNGSVQRINSAQVGTFVPVTFQTGEREVFTDCLTFVLHGNQMIKLMSKRRVVLMEQTIFAAPPRSFDH